MRIDRRFSAVLLAWLALAGWPEQAARAADPPAAAAQSEAVFRQEELDQMLAPLALYPDALLAQVLMASTYPGDVADAVAWSRAHPDASGDDAVGQVANEPWDPSVQSLVAFPAVLVTLGQDPAWVQRVGDAFLAQPGDVMDSVQRLRRQAQAAGNLQSTEQQRVIVQPAASTTTVVQAPAPTQTIIIEPADPQVVYVPSYNPSVVYGTWPNPSYPPAYYPPPPGYYFGSALVAGLGFAAGVAVIDSIWGDCDWDHDDIDIDVDRYNNLNRTRQLDASQNKWQHNAVNRDGVPYRDRASRERYSQRLPGSEQRDALRGREPARAADRERARQSMAQRGVEAPATSNREARERAQVAGREMRDQPQARQRTQASAQPRQRTQSSPQARQQARQKYSGSQKTRNNAFASARNPSQARASVSRGEASRASASRPKVERSGRPVQRAVPTASRGGGRRR